MEVTLSLYDDAESFMTVAGELLYARETVNNLMLGVSEDLIRDPEVYPNPFFATVADEHGSVILAAVMTPPYNIILAGSEYFSVGLSVLITHLQSQQISVPGVIGPVYMAESFVSVWKRMIKQSSQISMRQRVYELRSVEMPPIPPGDFRLATTEDSPIISEWLGAFEQEVMGETREAIVDRAKALVENGHVFVWENGAGLVSMAMKIRPIAHSITISGVYTPPAHRCQGFATALVAKLSQQLLDSGYQFVNLFTDLENPTSNQIYRQIGYHPIGDFRMYSFNPIRGEGD